MLKDKHAPNNEQRQWLMFKVGSIQKAAGLTTTAHIRCINISVYVALTSPLPQLLLIRRSI